MRNFVTALTLILSLTLITGKASIVSAEQVCTQSYGGGVVCGASTPKEHEPVKAGIADNLALIGVMIIAASGASLFISKRIEKGIQA